MKLNALRHQYTVVLLQYNKRKFPPTYLATYPNHFPSQVRSQPVFSGKPGFIGWRGFSRPNNFSKNFLEVKMKTKKKQNF